MADVTLAGDFEDVEMPGEVRADIGGRIVERAAHSGLRGEIDDTVEFSARERGCEGRLISDIGAVSDQPPSADSFELGDPRSLQRDRIIVVEIVDPGQGLARGEQACGGMHSNKTRNSG